MSNLSDEKLTELARLVGATADQEIDCAEMLNRLAAYLQAIRAQTPQTDQLRQVAQHLNVCPECREEFVALIKAEGLDPARVFPA